MKPRKALLLCAIPAALFCGASAPPQGRGQIAPISPAERSQGQQASASLVAEYGGHYEGRQAGYVATVARRVAVQSGLSSNPSDFTVTLLDSPVDNAFATPGGHVYVTRGLLALMNDEAELAGVLGHEVAHVAARHSQSRQKAAQRNSILSVLGQVLVGAVAGNSGFGELLGRGIDTGAQLATLGYSRGQETQSDDLAVNYLRGAGYDTDGLATMLASLAAQNQLDQQLAGSARSTPEWASTHPDPASRVRRAAQRAQSVGGTANPRNRDAFLAAIDGMLYGDDPRQGMIVGRDFLHPGLRLGFTVPQGFSMTNGARAVTITGPNTQAQFSSATYAGNLRNHVDGIFRALLGQGVDDVRTTTINGVPTGYAQARANSGNSQVDVTVFAYPMGGNAYHFIVLTPAGQGLGAATSLVESFRPLSNAEVARARPRYLRVVTVKPGDTIASLARRMVVDQAPADHFRVLNGLAPDAVLRPGDRVKIVTY
ncbi:MAG: M48 family metalloprotease [Sphingomonas sp.]|uniref:M48 family metalloprotease n=1 Tax=Sphingomonas sp. TaxID=28214 RepID=UPI001B203BCC|nr:M48 family metalloprotease [Sphingomonas sp.]MBO9622994.1 M48 family metalloprotease [Sphingomonas sp.]